MPASPLPPLEPSSETESVSRPCDATSRVPASFARFRAHSRVGFAGVESRLDGLRQESPIRFLHPDVEPGEVRTSVIANTAGGVVGGDRLACSVMARDEARILVTGQAAEKIYRSAGEVAELDFAFTSRGGAVLEVLPQGTILFEGSKLDRRTVLETAEGGVLLYGELLHFGRVAMGEPYRTGRLNDRTEIRVDGRLVLVDVLRLAEDTASAMASRAGLAGARCAGVAYLVHPDAARFVGGVREALELEATRAVRASAGCFDAGPLVVRWLAEDGAALRRSFGSIWAHLRSRVLDRPARLPRIWSI
ncbi:MAG: urease accessory protein UreD [Deltaproteobacteria bacterium]|nr:urease accessory protein UreD [Deltaproteobacteria bacterium]